MVRSAIVFGEPTVDAGAVAAALRSAWDLRCRTIEYARVGFGSYHWWVTTADDRRLFVTVDDLSRIEQPEGRVARARSLRAAFTCALRLSAAGHDFVRAPVASRSGEVAVWLDDWILLSLWPFVEGRGSDDGPYRSTDDRRAVLRTLRVLHDDGLDLAGDVRVEDFEVPNRGFLERAVDGLLDGWDLGPYGARAHDVVVRHRDSIRGLLAHYDRLVAGAPPRDEWVLTHGEPHAANVIFTADGPVLIDWDTAEVAPPERDLWMVVTGDERTDRAYAGNGPGRPGPDPGVLHLYQAQWELTELAGYLRHFHGPHGDDPDDAAAWADLADYVPIEPRWPELQSARRKGR